MRFRAGTPGCRSVDWNGGRVSLEILLLGAVAFSCATAGGVLFGQQ